MQDRIPGVPGQYKGVIAPEQVGALQSGEPFSIQLQRDDQPVVEGTPYSKAAVLPEELAKQLCPEIEDPAPKDAFQALADRQLESREHPGCYYRMVGGEMEWLNPPMVNMVEYRTTDRWGGKPVYVKRIDLGNLPDASSRTVGHGLSKITFISAETLARATDSTLVQPFPFFNNSGELRAKIHLTNDAVNVYTYSNISNYTAVTTLRYVK